MLDRAELERAVEIHRGAYRLLLWMAEEIRAGRLAADAAHARMSGPDVAIDWLRRLRGRFPEDLRPQEGDLESWAHMLSSFLNVSFEIGPIRDLRDYCCDFCTRLRIYRGFRVRNPSSRAREEARRLKATYLREIGADGLDARRPELAVDIAMAAYGRELIRRTRFAGQGPGILALWREFAWEGGRPRRGFELRASAILAAQDRILAAARSEAG